MASAAFAQAGDVIAEPGASDQQAATTPASAAASTAPSATPAASGMPGILDVLVLFAGLAVLALFFRMRWNRLRNAPQHSRAIPSGSAIALLFGFLLLGPLGTAIVAKALGISAAGAKVSMHDAAILTLGAYAGQSIALAVFIYLRTSAPRSMRGRCLGLGRSLAIGIMTLLCAWPVLMSISNLIALAIWLAQHRKVDLIAHESLRMFMTSPFDRWYGLFAFLVIVIAPIMEEVMYRGLLQTPLVEITGKRWRNSRWPAVIVTSAIFALMHGSVVEPHAIAALFALSLALGWAYEKTGRLATSIVMHGVFNAANLFLALLIVQP